MYTANRRTKKAPIIPFLCKAAFYKTASKQVFWLTPAHLHPYCLLGFPMTGFRRRTVRVYSDWYRPGFSPDSLFTARGFFCAVRDTLYEYSIFNYYIINFAIQQHISDKKLHNIFRFFAQFPRNICSRFTSGQRMRCFSSKFSRCISIAVIW